MKRKLLALALAATAFKTQFASALGLGDIELESYLNEPLNARIEILNTEGLLPTQILVKLASDKDFERVGIERNFFLTGINFQVVVDTGGESYVAVTTREPVREPYLDFVLETKWPSGRLLREYTLLLDPPVFDDGIVISATDVVTSADRSQDQGAASSRQSTTTSRATGEESITDRPQTGQNYRVKPNETLWEIALEAKLPGSSVQATMLEIQRQNPDAFINNNINLLKAGRVVYLPTELDASLSDSEVVLANIRRQNQDWRAGRVSQPAAKLRIAADSVDTDSESAGTVATKDRSASETSDSGFAVNDERLAQLQKQLASIEDQLAVMQAIIETKDEQIALLRDALGNKDSAPVAEQQTTAKPPQETTAQANQAEVKATETESKAPATVVDLNAPAVKAVPEVSSAAPTKSEGLSISMIAGGVGLAALLAALGLYWQRRRSSSLNEEDDLEDLSDSLDDDVFAGVSLSDSGLEIDHDSNDDDLPSHVTDSFRGSTAATNEYASDMDIEDALAEADIYIAYGRINQAIDLLQGSLEKNPSADECRLKLVEVLVDAGREDDARNAYQGVLDNCSRDIVVRADELMMRGGFIEQEQSSNNDEVFDLGADSSMFGPFGDALDSLLDEKPTARAASAVAATDNSADDSTVEQEQEHGADASAAAEQVEVGSDEASEFDLSEFEEDVANVLADVPADAAFDLNTDAEEEAQSDGPDEVDAFFDQLQTQQQARLREEREAEMRARERELAAQQAAQKGDALDDITLDHDEQAAVAEASDELLDEFDLSHLLDDAEAEAPLQSDASADISEDAEDDAYSLDFSDMDLKSGPADMTDE
ncbi:MAG: FimV/HubP family polar landmark protein, partial [Aequoribacter sp.]|uniref:type IV pilus assembly protein FimV n=1 Tax=Aequoribacter sp. TaxID=2847771 RepID=UPI003C45E4D9